MKPFAKMRGRLSSAAGQWLALILALAVLGLASVSDFHAHFRHLRELALVQLDNRAALIEANVEHQLDTMYFALGNLQAAIADHGQTGKLSQADLEQRLHGALEALPGVRTLTIHNAEGTVLTSNRPELVGGNFAHRDYFRLPFAQPDSDRMFVSAPFRTSLGVLTITVSRAIVTRQGKFDGIVTASFDPEFFLTLLKSARSSEDMQILLAMDERTVFLGLPDQAAIWWQEVANQGGVFGRQTAERETSGAALPIVAARGEQRAVAVRWAQTRSMAPDNYIRVLVSRNLAALEADGYDGVAFRVGLFAAVVFISVFALFFFQRRQRRHLEQSARQVQALRDSEEFLRRIVDNLPGMVGHWTSELRCNFDNRVLRQWFGRTPQEMAGMRLQDLLGEKAFAHGKPFIRGVLRGESQRFEWTLLKADGTTGDIWVQLIPDRDGESVSGFLVLASDITKVKQTQRDLEQANAELVVRTRQAEAASTAKTHFLSSISHELRTPLHTLLGYARLLLKDATGEARRQLAIVERSGSQLLKLIDELLEFNLAASHVEELHPEPLELHGLLNQIEHAGRLLAKQGDNRFSIMLADDLPVAVWVDEQRLLQVLQNLVGNACKYTRNGKVTLSVDCDGGDGATAAADGCCRMRFAVEDSGVGIAAEEQPQIFDAFHRGVGANQQPGFGLGLSIAQQWVKTMGGEIQVQSTLGQGSRFFFTLELTTATTGLYAAVAVCEAFRDALAVTPRTVLVVDDVAENRLLLRDICQRWGFKVIEAGDVDSALTACMTATPPIDAALVDQFMPGMGGWEFLRRARRTPSLEHLPAVLISASAAQKPADFPPDIDFDLVLGKPLDEQGLACFLCQRLELVDQPPASCLHPAPAAEVIARVALPADELVKFKHLLDLGRVVRIEAWAEELATKDPAYSDYAEQVIQHCRAADLAALEKLAEARAPTV